MSTKANKTILFVGGSTFESVNDSIASMLASAFPNYKLVKLDVIKDLIKGRKSIIGLVNLFFLFREYGLKIFLSKSKLRKHFFRTPFIFNTIQKLLNIKFARHKDIAFVFQVHSMFKARLKDVPYFVYTDRTHLANLNNPFFSPQQLFSKNWIACEKTIYEEATMVFTRSSNISNSLLEQYHCPADKVSCVYAGGTVEVLDGKTATERVAGNILFVGRNWDLKGGPELVSAFEQILPIYPKATLTIIGCNPQLSDPNIKIIGALQPDELSYYYSQASIFCLPTKTEAFGMVFVEALQHKLPIIGTNIEAIPDFVHNGKNGYLVPVNDSKAIASALLDLLNNPNKCQQYGNYSYELAQRRYSWPAVGKAIYSAISEKISIS